MSINVPIGVQVDDINRNGKNHVKNSASKDK